MKKKFLACLMAGAMVFSMAACGDDSQQSSESTPSEESSAPSESEPAAAPTPEPVAEDASIDFEDGNMGFVSAYSMPADAADVELSVADFNGSKALQVKNLTGKNPYVAIDATSLLGADVAKVASMELSIGIGYDNGSFNACAGTLIAWSGESRAESSDNWSVYLATKNPYKVTATLSAGEEFVADAGNIFIVRLSDDTGVAAGAGNAIMYIDNIRFLDASGNLLTADSTVAFAAPEGFERTGHDTNLLYVDNETELEGFAGIKGSGWGQGGVQLTDDQKALIVPGSVLTINYSCPDPLWFVATATDANPNPLGNWLRAVNQDTFVVDGYVSSDNSCVQYTYEQLEAYLGPDFVQYIDQLQCESKSDWEVYNVTIGTKSDYTVVGSEVELEGFAGIKGSGWGQGGVQLTDEQKALIVPGSIITINYSCPDPLWFVATATDDNPNPLGNWLRAVNQDTFEVDGAVSADGSSVQYTYEQLAAYWGEDFTQHMDQLQCESKSDWEVFNVTVSKPIKAAHNITELEGFAGIKGSGWGQGGVQLTDDQKALLVPGSVITINYSCPDPLWFVATATDDNPNPLGNWLRAVNQDTFEVDGAVSADGSSVQYTYEQLAAYWGEDFTQHMDQLQCESKSDWEVYSVTVGMTE